MPQLEFARFLEENAADVRAPDAGELLDACRDLQVRRKVNFTKAVRTASDNENFEYSEETNTTSKKGDLELPTKFKLGLPVYFGDAETEVFAFLRWKMDDGALTLGIQLHRTEHVRQAVFKQIVVDIAEPHGLPGRVRQVRKLMLPFHPYADLFPLIEGEAIRGARRRHEGERSPRQDRRMGWGDSRRPQPLPRRP
jgi:hypothetical protein